LHLMQLSVTTSVMADNLVQLETILPGDGAFYHARLRPRPFYPEKITPYAEWTCAIPARRFR
jgi:hypothetical protein